MSSMKCSYQSLLEGYLLIWYLQCRKSLVQRFGGPNLLFIVWSVHASTLFPFEIALIYEIIIIINRGKTKVNIWSDEQQKYALFLFLK